MKFPPSLLVTVQNAVTEYSPDTKLFVLPWLFPSSFTQLGLTEGGAKYLALHTANCSPSSNSPSQRYTSKILGDLPGVLHKVSYMLPRISSLITQSVSQPETQAKLLFNCLFRNVSLWECELFEVRIKSYSSKILQVLA